MNNTFVKGEGVLNVTTDSDVNLSNIEDQSPPPNFVTTRGKNSSKMANENTIVVLLNEMKKENADQFSKLNSQAEKNNEQMNKILEQQIQLETSVTFLASQYDQLKELVNDVEAKTEVKIKMFKDETILYVDELENSIEDLQRKIRSKSIEVRNIPYQKGELLKNILETMFQVLAISLTDEDIIDTYRLPGKDTVNKPLILEMRNTAAKAKLLGAIKTYNLNHKQEPLNSMHLGFSGNPIPIYASDYLTRKAAKLYYLGRMLKRNLKFKYCWSNSGKIFLKMNDESPAIEIRNEKQIHQLEQSLLKK